MKKCPSFSEKTLGLSKFFIEEQENSVNRRKKMYLFVDILIYGLSVTTNLNTPIPESFPVSAAVTMILSSPVSVGVPEKVFV